MRLVTISHLFYCLRMFCIYKLHGPPMSVDKTDFGLVLYNHANFYRFVETSSNWSVKRISVFLCFSFVNQRHFSCITVYNRTVTNVENTVRAVHSCNSRFYFLFICLFNFTFILGFKCCSENKLMLNSI